MGAEALVSSGDAEGHLKSVTEVRYEKKGAEEEPSGGHGNRTGNCKEPARPRGS